MREGVVSRRVGGGIRGAGWVGGVGGWSRRCVCVDGGAWIG